LTLVLRQKHKLTDVNTEKINIHKFNTEKMYIYKFPGTGNAYNTQPIFLK